MVNVLKPIIAGVDASADGAWAAAVAWDIANRAGAQCLLVHAVREAILPPGGVPGVVDEAQLRDTVLRAARARVLEKLPGNVPQEGLDAVEARIGPTARVLTEVAAERDAGLIVLGGKRHLAPGGWLGGGGTVHQTVRLSDVPVLITTDSAAKIRRILAAIDLSQAAAPTIETAQRYAGLFDAELRVMHTIEGIPFAVEHAALIDPDALTARVSDVLEQSIWPMITYPGAERIIRHGAPQATIEQEIDRWGAHLVVVGSHGKGWVDRLLVGSLTERLVSSLPAWVLVVPTRHVRGAVYPEGRTPG